MKPEMGIFVTRTQDNTVRVLETSSNLKGKMNSRIMQLQTGSHPNKALQREWDARGEAAFVMEVLETLTYSKDETKTDYSEELEILRMMWEERLSSGGSAQ
ncbi:GIY-YIG nuclease family protein [Paenibacillus sp. IB182496]|uniref:GIY-YIG nuclease family protein n=2 Tax=Paenibacillus sabuli TaxID=2772509 RepID=A0A927BPR5_9BACL|nr:GIY-YIG nuclease family protein [Paenibacillus sabuli]